MSKFDLRVRVMKIVSVILMLISFAFGFTWSKHGFCLGDTILTGVGLPAWSNGTHGTHYTAILAMIVFLVAFFLFVGTIKKGTNRSQIKT